MQNILGNKAGKKAARNRRRRIWKIAVRLMGCAVALCTVIMLIKPAVAMEEPGCGLEEHIHSESCYERIIPREDRVLCCSYESLGVHAHTELCFDAEGLLICTQADYIAHTHNADCVDENGEIICRLPEISAHEHTASCYQVPEAEAPEAHYHTDACYEISRWELICTLSETPGHSHDESCYVQGKLICTSLEEGHSHDAACYEALLACAAEEEASHYHTDACYEAVPELICGLEEGQIPPDGGAAEAVLCCGEPAVQQHVHSEECFAAEAPGEEQLTCTLSEDEGHSHGPLCYGTWELKCPLKEHRHSEACAGEEEKSGAEDEPNTLRYRGGDYEISLRYDASAAIPRGAHLQVTELTGSLYREHLKRTYEAMGYGEDYISVELSGYKFSDTLTSESAVPVSGPIAFARFFDLAIVADGEKIEPADFVELTVRYDGASAPPAGEKLAVHFADSGTVEFLNAASPMSRRLMRDAPQPENTESHSEREFVFLMDSFSVAGTVTMGTSNGNINIEYNSSTSVSWSCMASEVRTITVLAEFDDSASGKSVIIRIPTGFQIKSYSATEATPEIEGVTKVEIDGEFKDYVLSSELKSATLDGNITGVRAGDTWDAQVIKGYTAWGSAYEEDVSTYGGDIEYRLAPGTQHVKLVVTLHINSRLLSHTASEEQLQPIEIITVSAEQSHTTQILVQATEIPVVDIHYSPFEGGSKEYKVAEKGEVPGRSARIPVMVDSSNYRREHGSYLDSAAFTLSYPEGVFLEPDSLFCRQVAMYSGKITGLVKNGTKEVLKGHLSVEWKENANGGGSVTWYLTNTYYYHGGPTFGAWFTANTDASMAPCYRAGDTITGFVMSGEFERNGKKGLLTQRPYERTLVQLDNGKDIRLVPRNFTRRDITEDFRTEEYDYALGGFDVYSDLDYPGNTFWFENREGLEVTALGLMGSNIRDITVVTNLGNEYSLSSLSENGTIQGTSYNGTLLELSALGGQEGEYITGCLFTADLNQGDYAYMAEYTCGSFVYYGQFADGNNDGSREGSVTLRLLEDGTSYADVQTAIQNGNLDEALVMLNSGSDPDYGGRPISGTDHTKIGWKNTGVNSVQTTVVNADTNTADDMYYIGSELHFTSQIKSGLLINTQDVLIDPVLVISLPEGVTLDTASVSAVSEAGSYGGEPVRLVQDGEATEKVIDGVTWTTYRFKSPEMFAMVAEEVWLDTSYQSRNLITASFDAIVDPGCDQYNLSMADLVCWDVRNTAYEPDTLQTVQYGSINGDAIFSSAGENSIVSDKNDFLGHGERYALAAGTGTLVIKPLINLYVDLGIKSVSDGNAAMTGSGFTTYNGLPGSVVSVIPGRYADVRLEYISTSNTPYYKGTAIYVPVPKMGEDYAKYFENIELHDPMTVQRTESFDYTMDLTGPVTLTSSDGDRWLTRYALRKISSNPDDYSLEHQDWEPVVQNGGAVEWLTAEQVSDWSAVAMIKFISTADIGTQEGGSTVMRLYVHDVDDAYGPAVASGVNYWRGYCKAVVDESDLSGNWKYTSVVAATPAVETLQGQIFIDANHNGIFDGDEPGYTPGTRPFAYSVTLSRDDGTMEVQALSVKEDGSFALLDSQGNPAYLPVGDYTVTVSRNAEARFLFANTGSSIGEESPEGEWHNNVSGTTVATWSFTVDNNRQGVYVHLLGVGLKATVPVRVMGVKSFLNGPLAAGEYSFILEAVTEGAPEAGSPAANTADGSFSFERLSFEFPGSYVYRIREDCSDPAPGIIYDGHITELTVTVSQNADGSLSAELSYDNSKAPAEEDRALTDRAAFTNAYGYILPETGGAGTAPCMAAGLMLTAAAAVMYIRSLRRKRE